MLQNAQNQITESNFLTAGVHHLLAMMIQNVSGKWGNRIIARIPKFLTVGEVRSRYKGVKLRLNTGEELGRRIFYYGVYEPDQEEGILRRVKPGSVFFDIGANIGIFSMLAAQHGAKVIAFEPSRKVLARLRENIRINPHAERIVVVDQAVADKSMEVEFFETRSSNWGVGRIFDYNPSAQSEKYKVQGRSLDDFVAQYGVPDLIKIDVEGAEWLVLQGPSKTLRDYNPAIMIEFHPQEIAALGGTVEKCVDILLKNGFKPQLNELISSSKHSWEIYKKP